jgi:hypothetical protein
MELSLNRVIEHATQAAGELTLEGTRLVLEEQEGEEVRTSVEVVDEEAKTF